MKVFNIYFEVEIGITGIVDTTICSWKCANSIINFLFFDKGKYPSEVSDALAEIESFFLTEAENFNND